MANEGKFIWNELGVRDVAQAKAFYETVIGWTSQSNPMPDGSTYTVLMRDGDMCAGILSMAGSDFDGVSANWLGYVEVADVDATVGKVSGAGGKVLKTPFDVPNVGRIAVISDPEGAVIGIMTCATDS